MSENSLKKGRYTKYSNKIGLYSNSKGGFVKSDTDVVLHFPFKDAVLEAGMSKEDVGRDERFLHLEIDSKDIDTLEEPKVLTDFRYIDKDGEKALDANSDIEFFDTEGNLKQNLLIKGNNLLALYTLRERLAGQVKLIYIDPPYNTGNDGFRYNDSFNHSAWLVFMRNRLEVAKELLSDNGAIFVQCDDNEQAYLKVLMDEIFGRDNFIGTLIHQRAKGGGQAKYIVKGHDYITIFAKDASSNVQFARQKVIQGKVVEIDGVAHLRNDDIVRKTFGKYDKSLGDRRCYYEELEKYKNPSQIEEIRRKVDLREYVLEKNASGMHTIVAYTPVDSAYSKLYSIVNALSEKGNEQIESLGLDFSNSKPEEIIRFLIESTTKENDIVLDYHLGSGTTSAVAQKMNRRWIGIEQMDYIEDVAKERLKKVVAGEQGGISKAVGWTGGGSFVYFELKKYNQEYIDRIATATSLSELEEIYVDMRNNAFLKFWFDRKEFEKEENFRNLDIDGRKQKLVDVLDENQLYLNYADMEDTRHKVTADEKTLTDNFYGSAKN